MTLLLILLIVIVLGTLPVYPYSSGWGLGWWPSGLGLSSLSFFSFSSFEVDP